MYLPRPKDGDFLFTLKCRIKALYQQLRGTLSFMTVAKERLVNFYFTEDRCGILDRTADQLGL